MTATTETPFLHLDPAVVSRQYADLTSALPGTAIHYAVKANPHPEVLRTLVGVGAGFDVASPAEVARLSGRRREPRPARSTPTRSSDAATCVAAVDLGVRLFVVDCMPRCSRSPTRHPGASVLCRILTSGDGLGLAALPQVRVQPGRRRRDPHRGRKPRPQRRRGLLPRRLAAARPGGLGRAHRRRREIFAALEARRHQALAARPRWRLPGPAREVTSPATAYGAAIRDQLQRTFGDHQPHTPSSPVAAIVAEAGVLHTTVVAVCWRGGRRWVYLDAGVFTGLVETLDEAIRYRSDRPDGRPDGPVRARRPDLRQRRRALREAPRATCRSPSRRATGSGCTPPAPTPRATRRSASTASRRLPPSCRNAARPALDRTPDERATSRGLQFT